MNETRLERIYADNRLKRFKTRNVENSSMKQIEIHKMLNIAFENLINAVIRDIAKSSDADSQIFKDDVTDSNSSNSKTRNIHARIKFNTRRSNRLIEIENLLSSVERNTSTTAFTTIDKISIEKE